MQGNTVIGSHYWNMDTFGGTNQYLTYHKEEPGAKTKESSIQQGRLRTEEVCSGTRWWECFKRTGVITLLSCTHWSIRWRWELIVRFKLMKTMADVGKNYVCRLGDWKSLTGVGSDDNGAGSTSGGYDVQVTQCPTFTRAHTCLNTLLACYESLNNFEEGPHLFILH